MELERLRRAESLERTMFALRDARDVHDVLAIVARSLAYDLRRACVAYELRDGRLRPEPSTARGSREAVALDAVDLETLRSGVVLRRESEDMVGILSDDQLRAALAVERTDAPLEVEEERYLRAVAAHASLALASALAFDQLRRYAAEGAALTEAARTILGFSELEPLASALCRLGIRLFAAERAGVYASSGDGFRRIAAAFSRSDLSLPVRLPPDAGTARNAVREAYGGGVIASRVTMPGDDGSGDAPGLLVFCRGTRFERADMRLAETFATLAALAIRNVDLYEQSTRANRALAESNAFKDDLMAMFAHDFKGPLTVISGFAELLFDVDAPDVRSSAETIVEQTRRLAKLSEDALALAATQSAGFSLQRSLGDLGDFVREAVAPLDRDGGRVGFRFPQTPVVVSFDRSRLRHVVENVVGNALKYSSGPVEVAVNGDGDEARIVVSDRGIGIPAAELERVFARFGRGTNARTRGIPGSGVGLYIAKKIIDVHGGRLEVTSTENEGSTFRIIIPLDSSRHPARALQPSAE